MKTVSSIFNSPVQFRREDGDDNSAGTSSINPRKYFSRKFSSRIAWHEVSEKLIKFSFSSSNIWYDYCEI